MNVAEVMTKNPVTIRYDNTLKDALERMEQVGCRHLPVMSAEQHLIGIVSDRDCRLAMVSPQVMRQRWQDEEVTNQTNIAAIMTPAPVIVEPDMSVYKATRLMLNNNISALPVMRGETLVGIITTSDLLVAFIRKEDRARQTMGKGKNLSEHQEQPVI